MNHIVIIAHAPLASALRTCALHVFPDCGDSVTALDVQAHTPPEETIAQARIIMAQRSAPAALLLTDIFGATPSNVARELTDGVSSKLITGVNLPMLLRAITYRHESLEALVARALAGGAQGVMQVAVTAPQNQSKKIHDSDAHYHQQ
jgi:PTS system ascorbate-specific IIA component